MTSARLNFQSCSGARAEKTQRAHGDTGFAPTNYRAPPARPLANQQGLPPHAQRIRKEAVVAMSTEGKPSGLLPARMRSAHSAGGEAAEQADSRKRAEHKTEDGKKDKYFLFYDGETVSGKVSLALKNPNKRLEHQGIKVEFIGQIELYYDRGNHHEFVSLVKDLARPGEVTQSQAFDFEFTHVEKPYESYTGQNVKLRYFLRATISRRLNDVVKEMDIVVHTLSTYPELNSSIKMEVGIEDCLHIEFEYNKSKYHLKDVIVGKIYFLLVRIKIKHMEIDIIKRETTGTGPNVYHENDTIAKYEIMDGAPVRGESIPIRLFLAGYELTPTMRDINKKFSVRYYLNLVLIDEEERRYFKQQVSRPPRQSQRASMSHQAAIASQRFEGTAPLGEARTPGQLSDGSSRQ
ncbi:PREDICTED: vacuolar protein sorting-associated protein 26B [Lipotes vexillifer]|uniref:Vacuolar protein sorting-associated protein 26B n=1 Tax=Lipotes vexillifer TaxID=118797 RepID=A0A340WUA0_LIPVE|nr:PREDICTED: vacuolar protein sorting-associated protein 26B [Lipotes vexillifer]